jgi:GAF domain-containing protein
VNVSTNRTRRGTVPPPAVSATIDPEYRALLALAEATRNVRSRRPEDGLQIVVDLARTLTNARYAALGVSDEDDRTEGFVTSGLTKAQLRGLKVPPQGHGPLGSLRTDGKPVRVNDLDQHEKAAGFPPRHPTMKTMLGVPIWLNGQVRGSLYVTDRDGSLPFRDEDETVLVTLARHAANIIAQQWY